MILSSDCVHACITELKKHTFSPTFNKPKGMFGSLTIVLIYVESNDLSFITILLITGCSPKSFAAFFGLPGDLQT